jgi:hypothetical protein
MNKCSLIIKIIKLKIIFNSSHSRILKETFYKIILNSKRCINKV